MGTDQSIAEWHLQNWARWMRLGDAVTKGYPDKSIGFSPANTVGADYWEIMCSDEDDTVSYTHLTLPTIHVECRSRWSPYH